LILRRANSFEVRMLRGIADYQFGYPAGSLLIPDEPIVGVSPSTRRIREVYGEEGLLAVLRAHDYLFSLSLNGARRLLAGMPFPRLRIVASVPTIKVKSIPCSAVVEVDDELRPGDEVIVVDRDDNLLGVGRLRLSPWEIRDGCWGEAVRVRKLVKGLNG
jgi:archaeosine-15-forming tRNA-guanine transglycosylase